MARNRESQTAREDTHEKVVQISRVTKVVKGGKNMSFRATVVVGDGKGAIGLGIGKSEEVPKAIRKGIESAKKNQIMFRLIGDTIAHEVRGASGASRVLLRPAPAGTGVIAGGSVRAVLEMSGIRDIVAKSMGSKNPINSARAAIDGLSNLMDVNIQAHLRGVKPILRYNKVLQADLENAGALPVASAVSKKSSRNIKEKES
jgi:small subunit ribosomal protein S5